MSRRAQREARTNMNAPGFDIGSNWTHSPSQEVAATVTTRRTSRGSAFGLEPSLVESADMRVQRFQAPTLPNAQYMIPAGDATRRIMEKIAKIEKQHRDDRATYRNDLRTLAARIDARPPLSDTSSSERSEDTTELLPSEEIAAEFPAVNLDKQVEKVCSSSLKERDDVSPPVRRAEFDHFTLENDDVFVDVVLSRAANLLLDDDQVDSAVGSPRRVQSHPARYACCGITFPDQDSLVEHTHKHAKPRDMSDAVTTASVWLPAAVRDLPRFPLSEQANAHQAHQETFTWTFLTEHLGGKEVSPGFWFITSKDEPNRAYWLLELDHEPFMPRLAGHHGAKITTFLLPDSPPGPEFEDYMDVPVFVSADRSKTFRYLGQYSQHRSSDKIGHDTLVDHVPASVLNYHAEQLARVGRPEWVTQCLKDHFWPKPAYNGPIPTDSACNTPGSVATIKDSDTGLEKDVKAALDKYADTLKAWKKASEVKVGLLDAQGILDAFKKPDISEYPALRPFWEYMQCIGYNEVFYNSLASTKFEEETKSSNSRISKDGALTLTFDKIQENGNRAGAASVSAATGSSRGRRYGDVYGPKAKKMQADSWRDSPGQDTSNLRTSFVHIDFNGSGPPRVVGRSGPQETGPVKKAAGPKPVEKAADPKPPVVRQEGWVPPHLRKSVPAPESVTPVPMAPVEDQASEENVEEPLTKKVDMEKRSVDKQSTTEPTVLTPSANKLGKQAETVQNENSEKENVEKQDVEKQTVDKQPVEEPAVTTSSASKNGQQPEKPVNPFIKDGRPNLEDAKSFASEATTAGNKNRHTKTGMNLYPKATPPHLRGK